MIAESAGRPSLAERIARTFPELAAAGDALPRLIAARGIHRRVPAGTVMFDERTPCGGFPLILDGTVRVVQRYANGRELELYRVHPGEPCMLSGSCLMSDAEYDATGIADADVELVVLPAPEFHRLMSEQDAFRRHVFSKFGARLASVMHTVEAVASQKLDQRLARLLLTSAGEDGAVSATHQSLADGIGSVREIVTRILRGFEERGWVELGRQRVRIVDRNALETLAEA